MIAFCTPIFYKDNLFFAVCIKLNRNLVQTNVTQRNAMLASGKYSELSGHLSTTRRKLPFYLFVVIHIVFSLTMNCKTYSWHEISSNGFFWLDLNKTAGRKTLADNNCLRSSTYQGTEYLPTHRGE